jgi:hypothetical protein
MEMRIFGRTGLKLSVLGFGCGAVGGLMVRGDPLDQERTIARAISGHTQPHSRERPLSGVNRTLSGRDGMSASDPKRTSSQSYSTMFALNTNDEGMLRPSAFAVFEFTVNSNSVGSCTGRSAGLAPFKIWST